MIRQGSSNAYAWAVQPSAYLPSRQGKDNTTGRTDSVAEIGVDLIRNTNDFSHIMKGGMGTRWDHFSMVLWEYKSTFVSPEIWVVRNSGNEVTHAWESETIFDTIRGIGNNPLITTMQTGNTIIPEGGSSVNVFFPGLDILVSDASSVSVAVTAASIPSWTTGTVYADTTGTELLLKQLFRRAQIDHSINFPLGIRSQQRSKIFDSITDAMQFNMNVNSMLLLNLLWLRQASKILHNHTGETCIPLLMNNLRVDSGGIVSYAT